MYPPYSSILQDAADAVLTRSARARESFTPRSAPIKDFVSIAAPDKLTVQQGHWVEIVPITSFFRVMQPDIAVIPQTIGAFLSSAISWW